ncbi:hypothetical protein AB1L07_02270 [Niallia alba]|uniref:hypothetical protein n=1 Tax=Niallia alba TaxID=2729105 RepID=UPI0039A2DFEF
MAVGTQLDKELLIKLVQNRTGWAESLLRSLSPESLSEVYKYILKNIAVDKASVSYRADSLPFTVPFKIRNKLNLTKGDRFGIVCRRLENEIVLDPNLPYKVKMYSNNIIKLPGILYDRKLLREKDDVFVRVEGDKIVLKSFTYMI